MQGVAPSPLIIARRAGDGYSPWGEAEGDLRVNPWEEGSQPGREVPIRKQQAQFGLGVDAELGGGGAQVGFDRIGGDAHAGGDLAIGEAEAGERSGLLLTRGEGLPALPEVIALGEGVQAGGEEVVGEGVLGPAGLARKGLEGGQQVGIEGEGAGCAARPPPRPPGT